MPIKELDIHIQFAKIYKEMQDAIKYAKIWSEIAITKSAIVREHQLYAQYASADDSIFVQKTASVCDTFSKGVPISPDDVLQDVDMTPDIVDGASAEG